MKDNIFLGLGSNIEPCHEAIEKAISLLSKRFPIGFQISPFYQSQPFGGLQQSSYLNCCVCFSTNEKASTLLTIIQDIENQLGRIRDVSKKWSSRIIDIDILLFERKIIDSPNLTIPHYDLSSRDFFLLPLIDLDSTLMNPRTGKPLVEELAQIPSSKRTHPIGFV